MKIIKFFKDLKNYKHTIRELNNRIDKLEFQVNNPPLFKIGNEVDGDIINGIFVRYESRLNIEENESKSSYVITAIPKLEYFYDFKQQGLISQRKLIGNQ